MVQGVPTTSPWSFLAPTTSSLSTTKDQSIFLLVDDAHAGHMVQCKLVCPGPLPTRSRVQPDSQNLGGSAQWCDASREGCTGNV